MERFFELWPDPEKTIHGLKAGLYQALPDELGLLELEQRLLHLRARLFFPRVLNRQARELEFVEISRDQMRQAQILRAEKAHRAWVVGPYGIQEPHPRLPATPARELDFVVVPGLAFGLSGERIGMGAGFYDRFLARVPDLLRIVLAFDFQLLSHLEQNPWDQPMDWIITEAREFRGPKVVRWLQEWVKGKQLDQENP